MKSKNIKDVALLVILEKKKSVKQNDEEDMQLLMADSLDEINDDCAEYWWEGDKGKLSHEARRTSALF